MDWVSLIPRPHPSARERGLVTNSKCLVQLMTNRGTSMSQSDRSFSIVTWLANSKNVTVPLLATPPYWPIRSKVCLITDVSACTQSRQTQQMAQSHQTLFPRKGWEGSRDKTRIEWVCTGNVCMRPTLNILCTRVQSMWHSSMRFTHLWWQWQSRGWWLSG